MGRQTASPPPYAAGRRRTCPSWRWSGSTIAPALDAYLAHPAHQALGAAFNASLGAALVFDFDTEDVDAGGARRLIAGV